VSPAGDTGFMASTVQLRLIMTNRQVFEVLSVVQLGAVVGGEGDVETICTKVANGRYDGASSAITKFDPMGGRDAKTLYGADRKAALDKAWDDSRAGISACIAKLNAGLTAGLSLDQMNPEKM